MKSVSAYLVLLLLPLADAAAEGQAHADPAGRMVEGKLTDRSGRSLPGATVILRYSTRSRPEFPWQQVERSDSAGRFRFAGVPDDACEARLAAHSPGRSLSTPAEGRPADLSGGSGPLALVLEPLSVLRLGFRVPAGLPPVEGAAALDAGGGWIPFAGSEAMLTGLPEGKVGVKYHSEAYGGGVIFVDLGPGGRKDTVIDLARPDWIEGVLLDAGGSPVAGALYRSENAFRGMASRTGADGVFRVRRPRAGAVTLQFRDPRFRDTALVLGRDSGRRPLELRLDRGEPPIAGKVLPPSGRPGTCLVVAGPAEPRKPSARQGWRGPEGRRAVPGPDGEFSLAGLDPETYRLRVECPGANLLEAVAEPGSRLRPMTPGPAAALEARVAARGGAPLAHPAFRAFGSRPASPEAALQEAAGRGDSLGRFSLFPRFEGDNHLCASAPGFAPACRLVAAGDTSPAVVELEPARSVTVRVLGGAIAPGGATAPGGDSATGGVAAARPLPGARVRLRRGGASESAWSGESDADGVFTASGLGPGEYQVDVRAAGMIPFRAALEAGGDTTIEARLPQGAVLEGGIADGEGRPPRGLRILAKPAWPAGPGCPEAVVESTVRADGTFRLAGLGDCPLTVGVASAWSRRTPFLPLWRADGIRPGGAPLAIRLPAARRWEIHAVSGGLPLPVEASVHILVLPGPGVSGGPLGHPLGRTAFRGAYALDAFVGVRYLAVAGAPGYRERADTVVIPSGDEPFETRLELVAWPGLEGSLGPAEGGVRMGPSASDSAGREAGAPRRYSGWTVHGPLGEAAVQPDGSFRLAGLPPGPVPLDARDSLGRLVWSGMGRSGGGGTVIAAADSLATVEGMAVDAEGRPLAGATVLLRRRESPEPRARVHSDGQGGFRVELPPGAWLACPEDASLACTRLPSQPLEARDRATKGAPDRAAERAPARAPVRVRMGGGTRTVRAGFRPPILLPLRGGAALAGSGRVVAAAEAQAGDMLQASATFFRVPPGPQVLLAAAYAPEPAMLWWVAEPWEAGPLAPSIPGPGVAVTASDAEGRPLRGVTVRFLPRDGSSPRPGPGTGRPWGESELWNPPAGTLSGTDAAGGLLCLGVHPGRYWIYANHATHACAPAAFDLPRSGGGRAALVLGPGCPVRVKVTHAGHPASGARVEVFDSLGNRAAAPAFGPRDGEPVECGPFPPGRYRVAASAPGLGRALRPIDLVAGGEANLEAALPAAGWLELTGEGLEDKVFYLMDSTRHVTPLARQAEVPPLDAAGAPGGSLLFHGVPPDRYQVWMQGSRAVLGEVEIRPAELTVLHVGRVGKAQVALPARRG